MKMFKKPIEKIEIVIPDIPKTTKNTKAKDEEIYFERAKYIINEHSLEDCFDQKAKINKILDNLTSFESKTASMYHTYYFLKLFLKAANKDQKFNEIMMIVDKQINRMKKTQDEIKKRTDILKYIEKMDDHDLEEIFQKLNEAFDFCRDLNKELTRIQNTYYRNLKMTSFSICNDKNYHELDQLNKNIIKMIDEYRSIQEAYDFIYYNSGELIVSTVKSLVHCFETSNNKTYIQTYKLDYFLDSDYVVVLKFPEWIELFNKIRYVMRMTNRIELFDYLAFKNYYQELEKRYIIMLIYNEMKSI